MQYNNQYNIGNYYNINQYNPYSNKLVVLTMGDFNKKEFGLIKSFIFEAISKYENYFDISNDIEDNINKTFEGRWEVVVGEKDKFNVKGHYESDKYLGVNIGQYKIAINRID